MLEYKQEINELIIDYRQQIKNFVDDQKTNQQLYDKYNRTLEKAFDTMICIGILSSFITFIIIQMLIISYIPSVKPNIDLIFGISAGSGIVMSIIYMKMINKPFKNKKIITPSKYFNEQWSVMYKRLIIRRQTLETAKDTQMLNEIAQYDCCGIYFFSEVVRYFDEKYPTRSIYGEIMFQLWLAENFRVKNIGILTSLIEYLDFEIKNYDYAELIPIEATENTNELNYIENEYEELIPFNECIKQLSHHKNLIEKEKNQNALIQNLIKIIDVNIHEINDLKQQTALITALNTNQDSKAQQRIQPIIQKNQEKARNIYKDTFQLILETLEIVIQNKHDAIDVDVNESFRKVLKDYKKQQK